MDLHLKELSLLKQLLLSEPTDFKTISGGEVVWNVSQ